MIFPDVFNRLDSRPFLAVNQDQTQLIDSVLPDTFGFKLLFSSGMPLA
jgi:hypothetical protein